MLVPRKSRMAEGSDTRTRSLPAAKAKTRRNSTPAGCASTDLVLGGAYVSTPFHPILGSTGRSYYRPPTLWLRYSGSACWNIDSELGWLVWCLAGTFERDRGVDCANTDFSRDGGREQRQHEIPEAHRPSGGTRYSRDPLGGEYLAFLSFFLFSLDSFLLRRVHSGT
ncbi:hypothetical protein BD779DRAFT_1564867 [Infundibulicybe gibba]|nr:hypothetical protein BD779DRAFT_1564867 [Infundibulicybe gibba]